MMKLNVKNLINEKKTTVISSKESLEDIQRINWSYKVLNGEKKVSVKAKVNAIKSQGENKVCKVGDIIIINNYVDNGVNLSKHSFVVVDDENGEIQGLAYDFVCNVMSSFKNEEQKQKKLKYPGNFPISHDDTETDPDNGKDGYIKAEQLYYFNKNKINFQVIGTVNEDVLEQLFKFISDLEEVKIILDNL